MAEPTNRIDKYSRVVVLTEENDKLVARVWVRAFELSFEPGRDHDAVVASVEKMLDAITVKRVDPDTLELLPEHAPLPDPEPPPADPG